MGSRGGSASGSHDWDDEKGKGEREVVEVGWERGSSEDESKLSGRELGSEEKGDFFSKNLQGSWRNREQRTS